MSDTQQSIADARAFLAKTLDNIDPEEGCYDGPWTGEEVRRLIRDTLAMLQPTEVPDIIVMLIDVPAGEELDDGDRLWRTGDIALACPMPGCKGTEFYEVDKSTRWNEIEVDGSVLGVIQRDGSYDTAGHKCQSCNADVDLPQLGTYLADDDPEYVARFPYMRGVYIQDDVFEVSWS